MPAYIYLKLAEPDEDDSVLAPKAFPVLHGNEHDENIACGSCRQLIARCVSTRTLHLRYSAPKRLLIRCTCGAHNVIPAQIG